MAKVKAVADEAKDRAPEQAVRALAQAAELKKYTTVMRLIRSPPKVREQVDLSAAHQKDENPSIKAPENPEIPAKASDLYRNFSESAIILVLQQYWR